MVLAYHAISCNAFFSVVAILGLLVIVVMIIYNEIPLFS